MLRAFCVIVLACLTGHNALAAPDDPTLSVLCNPRTGALTLNFGKELLPDSMPGYRSMKVDWSALLKVGPQKNQSGDLLRTGSRTAIRKCGEVTLRLASGFLNANPQGELGALDFPVVELRWRQKVLLAKTGLEQCDANASRFGSIGPCTEAWATRIDVTPAGSGYKVRVKRQFLDKAYNDVEKIDVYE